MRSLYPLMLDAGQPAGDVLAQLEDPALGCGPDDILLVRQQDGVRVRWFVSSVTPMRTRLARATASTPLGAAMHDASAYGDQRDVQWAEATRVQLDAEGQLGRAVPGWLVVFKGQRFITLRAPMPMAGPPPAMRPDAMLPASPAPTRGGSSAPARGPTRGGQRAKPPAAADGPTPVGAAPEMAGSDGGRVTAAPGVTTETLLAVARVDAPPSIAPSPSASGTLVIGLAPAPSPTAEGVMRFESAVSETQIAIDVMVEAPDFTCVTGWKHTLTVAKSDPFAATLTLLIVPVNPADATPRAATVRVHYSYGGQPAGVVMRTIALGAVTAEDVAALPAPTPAALTLTPTDTPVDLTIRIARRDDSETARELIWTLVDCAVPGVALPDAPLLQKVGDRDNAGSFAAKVTREMNRAEGTVTVDNLLCSLGTLIRRAMPPQVLDVLRALHAAIAPTRLPRVLLLTDECHIPWELAYLDPAPDPARAPFLGAQFAVSRWIHGEQDIPIPPPATLSVHDLAIVLGSYENTNQRPLPHAKDETTALATAATEAPARFPRVTTIDATSDALVDLLNGTLRAGDSALTPELVHFACHGEVQGSGIAKRSVLLLSDGSEMLDTLFITSKLARTAKSFLFMNACQIGAGGEELGQYSGFPGYAIAAGFSGFIGPLWNVSDAVAKEMAVTFYRRSFGADGPDGKPVADVLADLRSHYLTESDPKKRQSTWLAYVHYGHPHFTLRHAQ